MIVAKEKKKKKARGRRQLSNAPGAINLPVPRERRPAQDTLEISVPFQTGGTGYGSTGRERHRIDTVFNNVQSRGVNVVFRALNSAHAKLENGRHVDSRTDAVRWVFERIAGQVPQT